VRRSGLKCRQYFLIRNQVGQSITGKQNEIPRQQGDAWLPSLRLGCRNGRIGAAQELPDDVRIGMILHFLRMDDAIFQRLAQPGMIRAELPDGSLAKQVNAGIAHVQGIKVVPGYPGTGNRGAHALQGSIFLCAGADECAGGLNRTGKNSTRVFTPALFHLPADDFNSHRRSHFAAAMPANSVRQDCQQYRCGHKPADTKGGDSKPVFVGFASHAGVAACSHVQVGVPGANHSISW